MAERDDELIRIATTVALSHLGTWYKWANPEGGGDDPAGMDCSGYAGEIMKSVGKFPGTGKKNAAQIYNGFASKYQIQYPIEGAFVFIREIASGRIIHVEYCLNDRLSIGASGGGSHIIDIESAIRANAFIKIRPIRRWDYGKYNYLYIDPFGDVE